MPQMYHQQAVFGENGISDKNNVNMTAEKRNEFGYVLEEAVCVHFKVVCECTTIISNNKNDDDGKSKSFTTQEFTNPIQAKAK